ncbi:cytochrome c3 family protein [Desulfamplus magnetovallimortis]|nr:NapC/NirT family cytochrome c [Desulfamplus magnetovallimortis]
MNILKKTIYVILMIASLCMFAVGAGEMTSGSDFCISCHAMKPFHAARQNSMHFIKKGNEIHCSECHVPEKFPDRYFYKVKNGIKDIYKTITTDNITRDYFNSKFNDRGNFVFNDACMKCHVAGLENDRIPREIIAVHKHILSGVDNKMNCVDCHGGMEHDGRKVFDWKMVKKFIHAEKSQFEAENRKIEEIINKTCLACHLKDGAELGGLGCFDFAIEPGNYLPLKIGIEFYEMPPTRTFRKYALEAMAELEIMVERNKKMVKDK